MPRGTEEGQSLELDREGLQLVANRPVSFRLYSSLTRLDDGSGQSVVVVATDVEFNGAPVDDAAFRLDPGAEPAMNELTARFPNLTVVDIAAAVRQAQAVIDQMAGATDLIRARARAVVSRPFTLINEMEARAAQDYIGRIAELEENLQKTQQKLQELQKARGPNASTSTLTAEQQTELDEFRKKSAEARRELKEVRRELRADSEALQRNTRLVNLLLVPSLIVIVALVAWNSRRRRVVTI